VDSSTVHPGTGANLTSASGERIQLSVDGSRLLLDSTGVLYDTRGDGRLALGVGAPGVPSDHTPLVGDGLIGATMDARATRITYLFQPYPEPHQLVRLDLNPADLAGAPTITDTSIAPAYVLTEGRSTATVSARVSLLNPLWVGGRVLRTGLPDDNTSVGPLVDDGTSTGDVTASDGLFTSNAITTNCCAEIGPRTIRIKAETQAANGLRHATAVDVDPFAVVETSDQAPAAPTPVTPTPVTPTDPGTEPITPAPITPAPVTPASVTPVPITSVPNTTTPPTVTPIPGITPPPLGGSTVTAVPPVSPITPEAPITPVPPVTPVTVTPASTGNTCNCEELASARATIAAQATRIAELEGVLIPAAGGSPPFDTTPPAVTPDGGGSATNAGMGTSQASAPVGQLITPDPSECTVAPRTAAELDAILASPANGEALAEAVSQPGLQLPEGQPADAATTASVEATYRQMTACLNAGNDLAAFALWTDDALRQAQIRPGTETPPTPIPDGERSAFQLREVRVLADGRLVAVWEERGATFSRTAAQVLVREGDVVRIGETLDLEYM
jgi:hypothetical protein